MEKYLSELKNETGRFKDKRGHRLEEQIKNNLLNGIGKSHKKCKQVND